MRATRIGLAVTGMLFAAIAVVVVLLFTMDLGQFKPQVETLVSDLLDRRTQIDGIFQPSLGAEIRIIAEDLWIENPDWATRESLIQVHRLDVSIDTWELLSGRILLTNLEVDDIVIGYSRDSLLISSQSVLGYISSYINAKNHRSSKKTRAETNR
jgi:uncharacterized protein involved in outer membrane biogenesis